MSTNQFGLDVDYFEKKLSRVLKSIKHYKPDEIARELARLVVVADSQVLAEREFNTPEGTPPRSVSLMHDGLAPCPFCGEALSVKHRKNNPYARCATAGCKGQQLPLLNLDDPNDIRTWNTRGARHLEPVGDATGVAEAVSHG